MKNFEGLSISSGKVTASACLYASNLHKSVDEYTISAGEIEPELIRFDVALLQCSLDLEAISSRVADGVGIVESEIFLAQKHIMNDAAIIRQIRDGVQKQLKNIEYVVFEVYQTYEEKFRKMDNDYLRERVADIVEIRRRLLDKLKKKEPGFACEGQQHCQRGAGRIIVAEEFTADMMAHMNFDRVRGFVTEHGGVTSHAAIIARSLGIPAVTGVRGITQHAKCGSRVLIDGDKGLVYLDPTDDLISQLITVEVVGAKNACVLTSPPNMEVQANASLIEDVRQAKMLNADGIGLYRTEMMFIKADRLLSEDEQFEKYKEIVDVMGDRPVTFRLIDVGGDKPLPFLRIQKETNPYLGWRGARFLLGNPDIFAMQIRALARVSLVKKIKVMIPMVIDEKQLMMLVSGFWEVAQSVGANADRLQLGIMFEVPSACLQAGRLFRHVEFGSIGSNDLIQYLFAVDRNNEQVSADYDPEHPVLWEMLETLSHAARDSKKQLSICGEMAGREGMVHRLLDVGIRSISVSPRLIPVVRTEMTEYVNTNNRDNILL